MRAGRKPKPTAVKKLAGNPGQRPLNESEPRPEAGAPRSPGHLNTEAREAWKWLCRTLGTMGILAKSDRAIMALYSDTWAEYIEVRKAVQEEGFVLSGEKGCYINPTMNVEAMLKKQLLQYLSELGLSATSRTRLHVAPKAEAGNAKDKFFRVVGA